MTTTAYSNKHQKELDVAQLLVLEGAAGKLISPISEEVSDEVRQFVLADIECPCCGAMGARVVSAAIGKRGQKLRQAHFRFVTSDGSDAHRPLCDFADEGTAKKPRLGCGDAIDFEKERADETAQIRELVCKGIGNHLFDQSNIRSMRQWFLELKEQSEFTVTADTEAISLISFAAMNQWTIDQPAFTPECGNLPNYNWRAAARQRFFAENETFFAEVRLIYPNALAKARTIAKQVYGLKVFNPCVLEEYCQKALRLATFIGVNGIAKSKVAPTAFRYKGAPSAFLAFAALLLSIENWDLARATSVLIQTANSPRPTDLTLGNVIGLNPFHDYSAWRMVELASRVPRHLQGKTTIAILGEVEARLREEYAAWRERT